MTIKKIDVFPERITDYGKYRVYRNLHQDCWSIKNFEYGTRDYGKVLYHAQEVYLENVKYVVSDAGFQRVHREGRKNVHAYVEGYPVPCERVNQRLLNTPEIGGTTIEKWISYNPHICHRFHFRENDTKFPTLEYRGQFVNGLLYIYSSKYCYLNLYPVLSENCYKASVLAVWEDEKSFVGGTHLQRDTSMLPISGNFVPLGA